VLLLFVYCLFLFVFLITGLCICKIISKDERCSEYVKSKLAKKQGDFFSQLKKVRKNRKIFLVNNIGMLEAIVMTVVKYGSEAWALQQSEIC